PWALTGYGNDDKKRNTVISLRFQPDELEKHVAMLFEKYNRAEKGIKAGLIRPISLWPYPYDIFDKITDKTKVVISAELSMGQMIQDVKLGVNGRFPVRLLSRTGGMVPTSLEIAERTKKILEETGGEK
ncbi:MAG: 3-methyl-2-oxobutanoate dehydrogenase subunit beta, partial [Oscillospiraceae bacterium]|nr:3-methyl-2-oxobutanoate dehydrogenase subunit beta [Oscillospiraceae bacterium]